MNRDVLLGKIQEKMLDYWDIDLADPFGHLEEIKIRTLAKIALAVAEDEGMLPPLVDGRCECNTYQECPYHNQEEYERFYKWENRND